MAEEMTHRQLTRDEINILRPAAITVHKRIANCRGNRQAIDQRYSEMIQRGIPTDEMVHFYITVLQRYHLQGGRVDSGASHMYNNMLRHDIPVCDGMTFGPDLYIHNSRAPWKPVAQNFIMSVFYELPVYDEMRFTEGLIEVGTRGVAMLPELERMALEAMTEHRMHLQRVEELFDSLNLVNNKFEILNPVEVRLSMSMVTGVDRESLMLSLAQHLKTAEQRQKGEEGVSVEEFQTLFVNHLKQVQGARRAAFLRTTNTLFEHFGAEKKLSWSKLHHALTSETRGCLPQQGSNVNDIDSAVHSQAEVAHVICEYLDLKFAQRTVEQNKKYQREVDLAGTTGRVVEVPVACYMFSRDEFLAMITDSLIEKENLSLSTVSLTLPKIFDAWNENGDKYLSLEEIRSAVDSESSPTILAEVKAHLRKYSDTGMTKDDFMLMVNLLHGQERGFETVTNMQLAWTMTLVYQKPGGNQGSLFSMFSDPRITIYD